jgi:hypothetical protein
MPPGTTTGFRHFRPRLPVPGATGPALNPFSGSLQEAALEIENDTHGESHERRRDRDRSHWTPDKFVDAWGGKVAFGAGFAGAALGIPGLGLAVGLRDLEARKLNRERYNRMGAPYGVRYDGPILNPRNNLLNSGESVKRHFNQAISTPAAQQNRYEFEAYPDGRTAWSASVPKRSKTKKSRDRDDDHSSQNSNRGGGRGGVDYDKLGSVESRPNYGGPR